MNEILIFIAEVEGLRSQGPTSMSALKHTGPIRKHFLIGWRIKGSRNSFTRGLNKQV